MAQEGLKVLTYAFKEMPREDYEAVAAEHNMESDEFRAELEKDLVYIATFGLKDNLRDDILRQVHLIKNGVINEEEVETKQAQVQVRMVSGDHIETCKSVALQAGIVTVDTVNQELVALTGEQFREAVGEYSKIWDPVRNNFSIDFADKSKFDVVRKKLKILARASSEDKFVLVAGFKLSKGLVGMTGESITDSDALKCASVGMCMGTGSDVTKDNSDLIILDNNFDSIFKAIKWGRAIFENVKKFLQFQLTINLSVLIVVILSKVTTGQIPFNVIQLLWVNLIMDTLAAIALGTEPYRKDEDQTTKQVRIRKSDKIIVPHIWRNILVQVAYQVFVMTILMYLGMFMFFDDTFHLIETPLRSEDGNPTQRMTLNTICFHTFVLMNMFNQINCRVVDPEETNVFKTLFNNIWFWIIFAFEVGLQQLMIDAGNEPLGSAILGTVGLTIPQHITCWILGALSLGVNVLAKKIPLEKFEFTVAIDLESENESEPINKLMAGASRVIGQGSSIKNSA